MYKIVFVTKPGCGICHIMRGTWLRIIDHFRLHNNILFEELVLSDKSKVDMAVKLGITKTPTWIIFKDEDILEIVSGGKRLEDLLRIINRALGIVH